MYESFKMIRNVYRCLGLLMLQFPIFMYAITKLPYEIVSVRD